MLTMAVATRLALLMLVLGCAAPAQAPAPPPTLVDGPSSTAPSVVGVPDWSSLTSEEVAALPVRAFAQAGAAQLASLNADACRGLLAVQISAVEPFAMHGFTSPCVANVAGRQLRAVSSEVFGALCPAAAAAGMHVRLPSAQHQAAWETLLGPFPKCDGDCTLSAWSEWEGDCVRACAEGLTQRRSILRNASTPGACGLTCITQPCASCAGQYSSSELAHDSGARACAGESDYSSGGGRSVDGAQSSSGGYRSQAALRFAAGSGSGSGAGDSDSLPLFVFVVVGAVISGLFCGALRLLFRHCREGAGDPLGDASYMRM